MTKQEQQKEELRQLRDIHRFLGSWEGDEFTYNPQHEVYECLMDGDIYLFPTDKFNMVKEIEDSNTTDTQTDGILQLIAEYVTYK